MNTNMFVLASGLSDHDLLDGIAALAGQEREATAELVAHLAALDGRPSLYAAKGHGSLFSYCRRALRLSEDAACNRIDAARACRRFPVILDGLASGALSLTTVRLLRPHLTPDNHEAVLAESSGRSRQDVLELIARLAPRPDVPSSVRKLPTLAPAPARTPPALVAMSSVAVTEPAPASVTPPPVSTSGPVFMSRPVPRPLIEPTSPERYRVQFTVGKDTHDKLRRLQALLRREIPNGDPAAIFDRAISLLLEKVERAKTGAAAKPRPIRPGTDMSRSRHIPHESKRVAWRRDGGRCGFVAPDGQRCGEHAFLEHHHLDAYALGGPSTPENIALRCRRHNQYEAERVFGPRKQRE
jgi:hypothetical protein